MVLSRVQSIMATRSALRVSSCACFITNIFPTSKQALPPFSNLRRKQSFLRFSAAAIHQSTSFRMGGESGDPAMAQALHPVAAAGFNADQGIYETARPSFPPAAVEFVAAHIATSLADLATASETSVLDLAAGTGKWTRLLRPFGIDRLVAVEPSPGMRREFERLCPEVTVLDGSATAIPLPDRSVDVIFVAQSRVASGVCAPSYNATAFLNSIFSKLQCILSVMLDSSATEMLLPDLSVDMIVVAQAFHWFANVAALTEMHRVLKSGGTVVLIWNLEDSATPWVARLREAYEKHEAGSPQYRLGLWRRPFEEAEMVETVARMFRLPYQERQFKHVMTNTSNGVWQRVLSKSYIAVLSPEQKEELKEQVDRILQGDDVHWYTRDEGGDKVLDYPYNTDVVWFQKLD